MTDEELLETLRRHRYNMWKDDLGPEPDKKLAADRIEALIAERDDLQAWKRYWSGEYDTVLAGRADEYDRAEAAEAKLAKAVKALEFYAYGHAVPPSWQHAHNTLAEIKGENHE